MNTIALIGNGNYLFHYVYYYLLNSPMCYLKILLGMIKQIKYYSLSLLRPIGKFFGTKETYFF